MSCPKCIITDSVLNCQETIEVGTFTEAAADIDIYIRNISTGRLIKQADATTGAEGQIIIDTTDPEKDFYAIYFSYEIWITRPGEFERLEITTDEDTSKCLLLEFEKVWT